jgi:hypothetical protein
MTGAPAARGLTDADFERLAGRAIFSGANCEPRSQIRDWLVMCIVFLALPAIGQLGGTGYAMTRVEGSFWSYAWATL